MCSVKLGVCSRPLRWMFETKAQVRRPFHVMVARKLSGLDQRCFWMYVYLCACLLQARSPIGITAPRVCLMRFSLLWFDLPFLFQNPESNRWELHVLALQSSWGGPLAAVILKVFFFFFFSNLVYSRQLQRQISWSSASMEYRKWLIGM